MDKLEDKTPDERYSINELRHPVNGLQLINECIANSGYELDTDGGRRPYIDEGPWVVMGTLKRKGAKKGEEISKDYAMKTKKIDAERDVKLALVEKNHEQILASIKEKKQSKKEEEPVNLARTIDFAFETHAFGDKLLRSNEFMEMPDECDKILAACTGIEDVRKVKFVTIDAEGTPFRLVSLFFQTGETNQVEGTTVSIILPATNNNETANLPVMAKIKRFIQELKAKKEDLECYSWGGDEVKLFPCTDLQEKYNKLFPGKKKALHKAFGHAKDDDTWKKNPSVLSAWIALSEMEQFCNHLIVNNPSYGIESTETLDILDILWGKGNGYRKMVKCMARTCEADTLAIATVFLFEKERFKAEHQPDNEEQQSTAEHAPQPDNQEQNR